MRALPLVMLVLLLPLLVACHDDDNDHDGCIPPHKQLTCKPCDGKGNDILISTSLPVPIVLIVNNKLCFTAADDDLCWYNCPAPIEESYNHGLELCGEEGGGD